MLYFVLYQSSLIFYIFASKFLCEFHLLRVSSVDFSFVLSQNAGTLSLTPGFRIWVVRESKDNISYLDQIVHVKVWWFNASQKFNCKKAHPFSPLSPVRDVQSWRQWLQMTIC